MPSEDVKRLLSLVGKMEAEIEYKKALSDLVPEARTLFSKFDAQLARMEKRARGQRTKLNGGQLFEDIAIDLVKLRKDLLKAKGVTTFDAWDQARREVGKAIHISPSTLEDWQRGARKRERKKPIEKRRYRRKLKAD